MNYYLKYMLVLLLSCSIHHCICSQEVLYTFEDNYQTGSTYVIPSDSAHFRRVKTMGYGTIRCQFDDDVPAAVRHGVEKAAGVWQCYLSNEDTLSLRVMMKNSLSNNNCDVVTKVIYIPIIEDLTSYPKCLLRHHGIGQDVVISEDYDAAISFNSDVDWGFGLGEELFSKKNATFAALRSIALAMGFGSSVETRSRYVAFRSNYSSPFDKLIFSESGDSLSQIPMTGSLNNPDLNRFVCPDNGYLYVKEMSEGYKLYAPPTFENHRSLKYLINSSSLMNYEDVSYWDMEIDAYTLDILNALGWGFNTSASLTIVDDDVSTSGITSAYTPHTFRLLEGLGGISDSQWTFKLPLASDGTYQTICTSESETITIPSIINEDVYEHDMERMIHGVVSFEGLRNGQTVKSDYRVSLALKPKINRAEIINIAPNPNDDTYYDAILEVEYEGTHYCYVTVEEEYDMAFKSYLSSTPYYTHINLPMIDSYGYAIIEITLRNDYGADNLTLTIPSQDYQSPAGIRDLRKNDSDYDYIDILTQNSIKVGRVKNLRDMGTYPLAGLFFLNYVKDGKVLKTNKYNKR